MLCFWKLWAITTVMYFSIFNEWEGVPSSPKKFKKFKIGEGVPYSESNRDKTNIQTKNFIRKNICDNEKYIPTTKYVSITPPQKVQEKYFGALIFETCPPVSQDTVQYSRYSLTIAATLSILDVFAVRSLWTYSIILSFKQINKRGITLKLLLTQSKIMVWSFKAQESWCTKRFS